MTVLRIRPFYFSQLASSKSLSHIADSELDIAPNPLSSSTMMSSTPKAADRARSVTSSPASSFATLSLAPPPASPLPATKANVLDRAASFLSSLHRKEFVALMEARHVYRFASYTGTGTYRHTRGVMARLERVTVYSLLRGVYPPERPNLSRSQTI